MAAYKDLIGQKITKVTSNPGEPKTGQMWYNSTTGTLKGLSVVEAFSAGGPATTARWGAMSFGSQTAGVMAAGNTATARTGVTEEYNGSGFSTGGTAGTARYRGGGAGTETAGLIFGGESPGGDTGDTEEYNGSSWSEQNNLSKARRTTGFGVQTAAYAVGGYDNANKQSQVESYDGTSWTSGTALPLAGLTEGGSGTTSSGRTCGGFFGPGATHPPSSPQTTNNNIGWNGSSWSDDTALPSNRYNTSGFGTSADDYYAAGGRATPPNASINTVNYWNGTSWAVSPSLATARYNGQGQNGTPSAFVYMSGNASGTVTGNTEEFNKSTNTITAGAFSSGTNLPTEKGQGGGCGTQTAAMITGGLTAPAPGNETTTFHYDGSSWTSGGALPSGRRNNSAFGFQTAAVTLGNLNPVNATIDVYNGSSWTGGTSYPSPNSNTGVAGTTTAGLVWGGDQDPGFLSTTNEYGGSWTSGGALPAARSNAACAGTQTAAVTVGGRSPDSTTLVNTALEYDGTNWSSSNNDLVTRYNAGGAGIQTSALIFGGQTPSVTATATLYDGTSFVTQPSMGTARFLQTQGLGATSTVALAAAGQTTTRVGTVEEFTGETTAANITDFTTS